MRRLLAQPDWLPRSVWPFQTFTVDAEDSALAVTDVGSGPTLLMVHVGMGSFLWRDLAERLMTDFRCVFFDVPGTGRTLTDGRKPLTLAGAAQAVATVIWELELKEFTLVVHDLGGPAGLAAVAPMAERVRGIVAMNAFGWRPEGNALRFMLALMASRPMQKINAVTAFLPKLTSTAFGVGRHMDEASRQAFLAGIDRRGRKAFHEYMRDARTCDDLYAQVEAALAGPLSRVPLLTIFGERNDPFGFQQRWKKMFPEARQVVVEKGNHFPMCDDPNLVARTIADWYRERVKPEGRRKLRTG